MIPWLDSCRKGGRDSECLLSWDMLLPVLIQPVLVVVMSIYSWDSLLLVSLACAFILLSCIGLAKFNSGSQLLYYWMASSVAYIIIVFENIVVALSEIEMEENLVLILFGALALIFLYLTRNVLEQPGFRADFYSNTALSDTCPICRVKMGPRSYHCRICQICIPKYDYHCYWLSCCIGEINQHLFVTGIIFGILSLGYASLLILTTICQPEFIYGVLLPKDCPDVSATIGMFACFVSGVYCMELAILLLFQLMNQLCLISRGYSFLEWKEQFRYNMFRSSPYSKGFIGNWIHFFKNFRKVNLCSFLPRISR